MIKDLQVFIYGMNKYQTKHSVNEIFQLIQKLENMLQFTIKC